MGMTIDIYSISPVFWTVNKLWAFQYVAPVYRLYGEDGNFVKEFGSFKAMNKYILENGGD